MFYFPDNTGGRPGYQGRSEYIRNGGDDAYSSNDRRGGGGSERRPMRRDPSPEARISRRY